MADDGSCLDVVYTRVVHDHVQLRQKVRHDRRTDGRMNQTLGNRRRSFNVWGVSQSGRVEHKAIR